MRLNDEKVQKIARETGMLFMKDGRETGTALRVDGLEMSFSYENPEECAHATVCLNKRPYTTQAVYMDSELDINLIKSDFPQFFK